MSESNSCYSQLFLSRCCQILIKESTQNHGAAPSTTLTSPLPDLHKSTSAIKHFAKKKKEKPMKYGAQHPCTHHISHHAFKYSTASRVLGTKHNNKFLHQLIWTKLITRATTSHYLQIFGSLSLTWTDTDNNNSVVHKRKKISHVCISCSALS